MTSNRVKELSECKREIELEIPAERVSAEMDKIVSDYARRAKIPGFRPGKAPRDIVKRRYYKDIKESLINSLIPEVLSEELASRNLDPVASPTLNDLSFEEGQPLSFQAAFEVWPEFELPPYKEIEVEKNRKSVTDEDVEHSLKTLQSRSAEYQPVEGRGVHDGDYVVAQIESRDTADDQTSASPEKVVILAGHPENEEALNENILEMKPDQEKMFRVSYPENHKNSKLAGKELEYTLKIEEIKEKKLPELDDEFAKSLGDYPSLEDLRGYVRKELDDSRDKAARRDMGDQVVKAITDSVQFELPESAVDQETMNRIRRFLSTQPHREDLSREDYDTLRNQAREQAERSLKNHLILSKIADKENIQVTEEEITEELKILARDNNVPLSQVIERINQEGHKEELRDTIRIRKTVDFLLDNAIIK